MTRDEILAVLEDGAFERLKGSPENLEVEFKREPYRLDQENQKFELAKDVSALANAAGGSSSLACARELMTKLPLMCLHS